MGEEPSHLTTPTRVKEEPGHMMKRILQLTLEIIYLLTGEDPPFVSGDHVTIKVPPTCSLIPGCSAQWRILEVTSKITELLTGEVPLRCEDIAIYLSVEEREYLEGHKHLYKDVVIEDKKFKSEDLIVVKVEVEEEADETSVGGDEQFTEETFLTDDRCRDNKMELYSIISSDWEIKDGDNITDFRGRTQTTPNPQPECGADLSSDPTTQVECFPDHAYLVTNDTAHTLPMKSFSCSECGKSFSRKSGFITHTKSHLRRDPLSCPECGKCFSFKSHLIRHKRIHTADKPYSCLDCGKCFTNKHHLTNHERVHVKVKLFSCTVCGKCFSQQISLFQHERDHRR